MISVIIPTFNRQDTILSAINSVRNQTIQDIEIIIVDDGSTDDTVSILKNLKDKRIRIIKQNHLGACAARNRGIKEANGEYIAFHDSDDICRPNRLMTEYNCIKETGADFVCGNVLTHLDKKEFVSPNKPSGWLKIPDDMFNITTMTFFAKKTIFKKFKFDDNMPRWQDLDLLLSMCGRVKIYFCQDILCDYYRDKESMSSKPEKCLSAYELIIKKYPDIMNEGGLLYSRLTKMYADSKVALGRTDYFCDYKNTYKNNKTFVNFVWYMFAKFRHAGVLYKILHRQ